MSIQSIDAGLPASVDGEKVVLGAILVDNNYFIEAAEKLESEDFSLDSHRRIFLRMTELMNSQRAVDIVRWQPSWTDTKSATRLAAWLILLR